MRKTSLAAITLFILLLASCQAVQGASQWQTTSIELTTLCPEDVTIYFFDVGDADSILIKTSTQNVLIDGGSIADGATVLNYLSMYGVSEIDLLFLTHPHEDHMGGLLSVLQSSITVHDIIYNGYNYTIDSFYSFLALASTHNLTIASRDQVYSLSSAINFTVLNPTQPLEFSDINDNSIALMLKVGETSILLAGDTTSDAEKSMIDSGLNLKSQVLKVGHHGNSGGTTKKFLNAVTPNYAIISASSDQPEQEVLDRLTDKNATTYTTYNDGTIILSLKSTSIESTASPPPITQDSQALIVVVSILIAAILAAVIIYKKKSSKPLEL